MTFTTRVRLSLLLVALVPPLVAIGSMYSYSSHQFRQAELRRADRSLVKFSRSQSTQDRRLRSAMEETADSPSVRRAALQLSASSSVATVLSAPSSVDFLELIDRAGLVRASAGRPALVGKQVTIPFGRYGVFATVEYDLTGAHPARAVYLELDDSLFLYGGRYITESERIAYEELTDASVRIVYSRSPEDRFSSMTNYTLYGRGDTVEAVVSGGADAGYYVVLSMGVSSGEAESGSLLTVIGLVSVVSIGGALAVGWYFTGRAKREVDNLIEASERVAAGDFSTPVMAYDEGEFSRLADSFSDMMVHLRRTQQDLATAERIAAWESVGRTIAHEIKNPLTPISISIDDLRRSHQENLPGFDQTLEETTRTIKSELIRLTRLLDEFISFARMTPPMVVEIDLRELLQPLCVLYRRDIESGRLQIVQPSSTVMVRLDPEKVRQVLVNLIKNSFESPESTVTAVSLAVSEHSLFIAVEDNGSGFPEAVFSPEGFAGHSSKIGGLGLGLVVCQRIVYDHGGEMSLSNKPTGGANVEIVIPRSYG